MKPPTRKTSATVYLDGGLVGYDDDLLFGNPGNWAWVEDRAELRVCLQCRVVYPPSLTARSCPRHGETVLIGEGSFALTRKPVDRGRNETGQGAV